MIIDQVITACVSLCQAALAGGKAVGAYKKKRLSETESELLRAAAQEGQFLLISVNEIPGPWVRVGNKNFIDSETNDPAYAAKYVEAFKCLCGRSYIRHEAGCLFMLTDSGFEKARRKTKRG